MQEATFNTSSVSREAVRFGCDVIWQLGSKVPGANLVVSPLSLYLVLSMLACGAHGDTQIEIASPLGWRGLTEGKINQAISWLNQDVDNAQNLLTLANAIFADKQFSVKPEFASVMKDYFEAEMNTIDFSSPQAMSIVNSWVNEKTQGKIPMLLDRVTPDMAVLLLNAIYFKGTWLSQFRPEQTVEDRFTLMDGRQVPALMMRRNAPTTYFSDQQWEGICMPYSNSDAPGTPPRFEACIIVPRPGVPIDQCIGDALVDRLTRFDRTETPELTLHMPKIKIYSTHLLNDTLVALGVRKMFTRQAEFGKMTSQWIYINYVLQMATLDVDEKGTEAAASSVATAYWGSAPKPPVVLRIDRPFLFVVRDTKFGWPWFMARVMNPLGA